MLDWLTAHKLPLGVWVAAAIDWITTNAQGFFDVVTLVLGGALDGIMAALLFIPPLLFVALAAIGAWLLHRSIPLALGVLFGLLLIVCLCFWQATIETLTLVLFATIVSVLVGVPVGIAAAHRPWLYTAIRPILDLMQT